MLKKKFVLMVPLVALLCLISVGQVMSDDRWIILPTAPVTLEARDGVQSYFEIQLSGFGGGYSVVSGSTYNGWCIDRTADMTRSPVTHRVQLYSSLNPPGSMANEKWDMVNYIINHKRGSVLDMQEAIWHFINMVDGYNPPASKTEAWAIIEDASANGNGYVPPADGKVAVICYPLILFPTDEYTQITIIELNRGSEPTSSPLPTPTANTSSSPSVPVSSPSPSPSAPVNSPSPSPSAPVNSPSPSPSAPVNSVSPSASVSPSPSAPVSSPSSSPVASTTPDVSVSPSASVSPSLSPSPEPSDDVLGGGFSPSIDWVVGLAAVIVVVVGAGAVIIIRRGA